MAYNYNSSSKITSLHKVAAKVHNLAEDGAWAQ